MCLCYPGPAALRTDRNEASSSSSSSALFQDLFFKYAWNNFLHFQVELCVTAILMHSVPGSRLLTENSQEEEAEAEGKAGAPENFMVTHVSVLQHWLSLPRDGKSLQPWKPHHAPRRAPFRHLSPPAVPGKERGGSLPSPPPPCRTSGGALWFPACPWKWASQEGGGLGGLSPGSPV